MNDPESFEPTPDSFHRRAMDAGCAYRLCR